MWASENFSGSSQRTTQIQGNAEKKPLGSEPALLCDVKRIKIMDLAWFFDYKSFRFYWLGVRSELISLDANMKTKGPPHDSDKRG